MTDARMEALICQYDESVQYRQKLADHNFAEELFSILNDSPSRMQNKETNPAQLYNRPGECKRLKEYCLEIVRDEVAKSCTMQFNEHTEHYKTLLNDFAIFLKTRSKSNENLNAALKSENDNLKIEVEALKLHNEALKSNLKTAHESLNQEKLYSERTESNRKNLEYLSEKLCSLLLKYEQRISHIEEMEETITRASSFNLENFKIKSDSDLVLRMDTSILEDCLDENSSFDESDYKCMKNELSNSMIIQDQPNECNIEEIFLSENFGIIENMSMAAETSPFFRCEECGELFETKHETQNLTKCSTCDVHCNTHSKHRSNLTTDTLKLKTEGTAYMIDKAQNEHCEICNRHYTSKSSLNRHIRKIHATEKSYESTTCGKRFTQKGNLKVHSSVHASSKLFSCSICNKGFKNQASKFQHQRVVHSEDRFECADCGKRCSRKQNLITHIRMKHLSKRQFKCNFCEKAFVLKTSLKTHKLVHVPDWPLKCSICDERFKYHYAKKFHERKVHKKDVVDCISCSDCGREYCNEKNFRRHQQKHHVSR